MNIGFGRISFLQGMGSVINIAPFGEPSGVGHGLRLSRTDREALAEDWFAVSRDLNGVVRDVAKAWKPDVTKQNGRSLDGR